MTNYTNPFTEVEGARYFHFREVSGLFGRIDRIVDNVTSLRLLQGVRIYSNDKYDKAAQELRNRLTGGLDRILTNEMWHRWGLVYLTAVPVDYSGQVTINRDGADYFREDALKDALRAYIRFKEQESARHREFRAVPDDQKQIKLREKLEAVEAWLSSFQTMPAEIAQLAADYLAEVQVYIVNLKAGSAITPSLLPNLSVTPAVAKAPSHQSN